MKSDIFYSDKLINFIDQFYDSLDEDLVRLMSLASEREGVNPTVNKPVGTILGFFSRLFKPKKVLELGTCVGVSTIIIAKNIPENSTIYTIDRRADLLKEATANFEKFNLKNNIKPMLGDIEDIVPKLYKNGEKFDMIFQDGGKKAYPRMHDFTVKMLKKNGILISDDVLLEKAEFPDHIKGINSALKKYNFLIKSDKRLDPIFIPLENGVVVARKLDNELE